MQFRGPSPVSLNKKLEQRCGHPPNGPRVPAVRPAADEELGSRHSGHPGAMFKRIFPAPDLGPDVYICGSQCDWCLCLQLGAPAQAPPALGHVRLLSCKVILWQLYEPTCDASCQGARIKGLKQREKLRNTKKEGILVISRIIYLNFKGNNKYYLQIFKLFWFQINILIKINKLGILG